MKTILYSFLSPLNQKDFAEIRIQPESICLLGKEDLSIHIFAYYIDSTILGQIHTGNMIRPAKLHNNLFAAQRS